MGSKQVPVGNLIWSLKVGGADTSLPQHSDSNPSVWFLIWKREDIKSVLGSHLDRNYRKNGKKKNQKSCWKQCFLDTGMEIEFNLIGFYLLVLATTWPLTYINYIGLHVITILVCN